MRWKERWLDVNGFSLGPKAEAYDARVLGLCGGGEAALTSPMVGLISFISAQTTSALHQKLGVYRMDLAKLDLQDLKRQLNVGFKMGEG